LGLQDTAQITFDWIFITLLYSTYTLQFSLSLYSDNWGVMSDTTYLIY
jgi:hypothetical protein